MAPDANPDPRAADCSGESQDPRCVVGGKIDQRECHFSLVLAQPATMQAGLGSPELPIEVITALIDTGATISTISPTIADRLRLPLVGQKDIGLADGSVVRVDIVVGVLVLPRRAGGGEFRLHELAKLAIGGSDMLFGMDALEGGTLTVATQTRRWQWRLGRRANSWMPYPPSTSGGAADQGPTVVAEVAEQGVPVPASAS